MNKTTAVYAAIAMPEERSFLTGVHADLCGHLLSVAAHLQSLPGEKRRALTIGEALQYRGRFTGWVMRSSFPALAHAFDALAAAAEQERSSREDGATARSAESMACACHAHDPCLVAAHRVFEQAGREARILAATLSSDSVQRGLLMRAQKLFCRAADRRLEKADLHLRAACEAQLASEQASSAAITDPSCPDAEPRHTACGIGDTAFDLIVPCHPPMHADAPFALLRWRCPRTQRERTALIQIESDRDCEVAARALEAFCYSGDPLAEREGTLERVIDSRLVSLRSFGNQHGQDLETYRAAISYLADLELAENSAQVEALRLHLLTHAPPSLTAWGDLDALAAPSDASRVHIARALQRCLGWLGHSGRLCCSHYSEFTRCYEDADLSWEACRAAAHARDLCEGFSKLEAAQLVFEPSSEACFRVVWGGFPKSCDGIWFPERASNCDGGAP
jgi:hypothetical protein